MVVKKYQNNSHLTVQRCQQAIYLTIQISAPSGPRMQSQNNQDQPINSHFYLKWSSAKPKIVHQNPMDHHGYDYSSTLRSQQYAKNNLGTSVPLSDIQTKFHNITHVTDNLQKSTKTSIQQKHVEKTTNVLAKSAHARDRDPYPTQISHMISLKQLNQ